MAAATSGVDAGQQAFAWLDRGWVSGNMQTQVLQFVNDLRGTFSQQNQGDHAAMNFLAILGTYASQMGLLGPVNPIVWLADMQRALMAMMFYCDGSLGNISGTAATAVLAAFNARFV